MAANVTSASGDNFALRNGRGQITRNSNKEIYVVAQNDTDNTVCMYKGNYSLTSVYSQTSYDGSYGMASTATYNGTGQSIQGNGDKLIRVDAWLSQGGTATGTVYCRLYAHSGTYGTSSIPTGSAIAEATFNAADVQSGGGLVSFSFASSRPTLENGTYYVITIEYEASNIYVYLGYQSGNPATGNACQKTRTTGVWGARSSTEDARMTVYTTDETLDGTTPFSELDSAGTNKPSGTDIAGVSAAIDSNDYIHISWLDDQGKSSPLKYIRFRADGTNDDWFEAEATVVSDIGEDPTATSLNTAIAVDSNNVPHIVYNEYQKIGGTSTYVGMYVNKTSGSWQTPVQLYYNQGNDVQAVDICIDYDNYPYIAFVPLAGTKYAYTAIGNANNATSFTSQNVDTMYSAANADISVSVDGSGAHWIGYVWFDTVFHPATAVHKINTAWSSWTISSTGTNYSAAYPSSAITTPGRVVLFYEDSAGDINYDFYNYSSWDGETELQNGNYSDVITETVASSIASSKNYPDPAGADDYSYTIGNPAAYLATYQTFLGDGNYLTGCSFYCSRNGSGLTGNVTAELYAHTGTYGSGGKPTGSPLATSINAIAANSISATPTRGFYSFYFDGTYQLVSGTPYCIVIRYEDGSATQSISVRADASGGHAGESEQQLYTGGWYSGNARDLLFQVSTIPQAFETIPYIFLDSTNDILYDELSFSGGPQTISLSTITLASSAVASSISPGAVSILLNALSIASSAQILTPKIIVTILLNTLSIASSAETSTISPGEVSILLNALNIVSNAEAGSVSPGEVSILLNALSIASNVEAGSVSPGEVSILLNELSIASSAETGSIAATVSILLNALSIASNTEALTVSLITELIVALSTLSITSSAETSSISPGAVSILLNALNIVSNAEAGSISPGAVSILLNALSIASNAEAGSVIPGEVSILLNALNMVSSAEAGSVIPGEVSILLNALSIASNAEAGSVSPGAVSILLNALSIVSSAEAIGTAPGEVNILLSVLSIISNVETLTVESIPELIIALNTLSIASSAVQGNIVPGAINVLLNALTVISSAEPAGIAVGEAIVQLASLILTSNANNIGILGAGISIALAELTIAAAASALSAVPGAVSIDLAELSILSSADQLTIAATTLIQLAELTITATAENAAAIAGEVIVLLNELSLNAAIDPLTILTGATSVLLSTLTIGSTAETANVLPGVMTILLNTLTLTTSTESLIILAEVTIQLLSLIINSQADDLVLAPGPISILLNEINLSASTEPINIIFVAIALVYGTIFSPADIAEILSPIDTGVLDGER